MLNLARQTREPLLSDDGTDGYFVDVRKKEESTKQGAPDYRPVDMAELLTKLQELRRLPPELHWYCHAYDLTNPAGDNETKLKEDTTKIKFEYCREEDTARRRKLAIDCLQLFGYDGEDVLPHQEYLEQQINRQLGRCDSCIVQYYKAKHQAMESLRGEYEEEEVAALAKLFDDRDVERIKNGLGLAVQALKAAVPSERGKDTLKLSCQLSLFEALSCQAFLADSSLVQAYFDEPFRLVQTNKRLRIVHYVPAVATFLFDLNQQRCLWAVQAWGKLYSPITKDDFDFAVRDSLLANLKIASEPVTDFGFVQRLWYGFNQIVDKLDNELITHSLRAMEVDIFRIALEHLQYNTPSLRFLMQTIRKLLKFSPKDFWESMGAISPTTVIEQVFNNLHFDKFIEEAKADAERESSPLYDMLSWIRPFMESLQAGHQAQACRSLTSQLLDRLQADRFPSYARTECYRTGIEVLSWTLDNCNREDMMSRPVGRIVAVETLQVASTYIKRILDISTLSIDDGSSASLIEPCLGAVKLALALECKSLRTDQETLMQKRDIQPGFGSYSPVIWDAVVNHLDRGNVTVARAALTGINDLIGLEKFKINSTETYTKEKSEFNVTFGHLTHLVCQMLERINDFNPNDLDKLYHHPDTATALFAALFSPDASTYEAGVNLIKSISSESARREAIAHLLLPFFDTTLNSLSWSIRRISHNRTYASCPRLLKTCTDVLDILCDSQSGLLRTRALSSSSEIKAAKDFWEHQWQALKVIYEMTEEWGKAKVSDSSALKEFCRDTMQFSERLFDQYSVYASAINSAALFTGSEESTRRDMAGKELLEIPAKVMEAMVKWLKLRDVYLAGTAVNLTKKVLERLSEWDMRIAEAPCSSLKRIIHNGPQGRTHLTPHERAELARALEANIHRAISPLDTDREQSATPKPDSSLANEISAAQLGGTLDSSLEKQRKKNGKIDLVAWRSKAKPQYEIIDTSDEGEFGDSNVTDQDILSASRSVEILKEQQSTRSSSANSVHVQSLRTTLLRPEQKLAKSAQLGTKARADQISFREKREREREAKKKRDADELAIVRKRIASKGNAENVIGENFALGNIGFKGKDHAPKTSSMMVSSGSESDSEDQLDHELFGGAAKPPKVSDAVLEYQKNRLQQVKEQRPIKKLKQLRSAKDMRARLAPDLVSLHKTILSWDFFHTGDFPPGSERQDYSLVSNTFRAPTDYQNIFEPLLILEAWQGFLKSNEEGNFKTFELKVANRLTVDSFIEVSTTMPIAEGKEIGISEADVVLMSKARSPTMEFALPHCFGRVFKISRKKGSMDVTYRVNVGNQLVPSMVPNAILFGVKVQSLTPLEREYGALLGLKYFDLCDEIIKAKPSPLLNYSEKQLAPLEKNYKINNAQAKAVRSAIDNDAFTLIQGPPGSGKTKTIVAIVGALLTSSFVDKGVSITRPQLNEQRQANPAASKKLLVCAPSNAAVDELVMRFKEGVKTINGEFHKLSVIRLGKSDAINANVLDVTLEELVNAKLNLANGKKNNSGEDVHKIMMAHKATCDELNALHTIVDEAKASGKSILPEQDREFEILKRRKQQLSNAIDTARDSGDVVARDAEISRRRIQQEILDTAHVICATLSGSGHEMFQNLNIEFETVIIDEAAQSIELSALIPLKYGCSKCVLVGDPKQLPPTVLSREAARFQYEQSLFVRMQSNHPADVHLLDTQYRMHPDISLFPSKSFYDGKLLDGENMAKLRAKPWHQYALLGAYRFFDVQGFHQSAPRGHSLVNLAEVEVALGLFDRLTTSCKGYDFKGKIGIITPYKSQLRELRARFVRNYGEPILTTVEFNTTDAFQGRESEVIIFSCVRASATGGIGFLSDIRRMNVGITRAKSSLWILGNSQSLAKGEFWGRLIQDARTRDRYTDGDVVAALKKPLLALNSDHDLLVNSSSAFSSTFKADHDIEMRDAAPATTVNYNSTADLSAKSFSNDNIMHDAWTDDHPKKRDAPDQKVENSTSSAYEASDGGNGLNPNANCAKCGSSTHRMHNCDNEDAKKLGSDRCFRCGSLDHRKIHCTIERCLECGAFGHTKTTCFSTQVLSRQMKEKISKSEAEHKHSLSRALETQRKKQLGDHAKEVPRLRATSKTPPPTHSTHKQPTNSNASLKRKRDPSPPKNAPKGPRASTSRPRNANALNANSYQAIPTTAATVLISKGSALDTSQTQAPRQNYDGIDPTLSDQSNDRSKKAAVDEFSPLEPYSDPQKTRNQPLVIPKSTKIDVKPSASLPTTEHPPPQPAAPAPNPTRPPARKRKEANPFIIPKDRRPRR